MIYAIVAYVAAGVLWIGWSLSVRARTSRLRRELGESVD
jgi:hypothetical protein